MSLITFKFFGKIMKFTHFPSFYFKGMRVKLERRKLGKKPQLPKIEQSCQSFVKLAKIYPNLSIRCPHKDWWSEIPFLAKCFAAGEENVKEKVRLLPTSKHFPINTKCQVILLHIYNRDLDSLSSKFPHQAHNCEQIFHLAVWFDFDWFSAELTSVKHFWNLSVPGNYYRNCHHFPCLEAQRVHNTSALLTDPCPYSCISPAGTRDKCTSHLKQCKCS